MNFSLKTLWSLFLAWLASKNPFAKKVLEGAELIEHALSSFSELADKLAAGIHHIDDLVEAKLAEIEGSYQTYAETVNDAWLAHKEVENAALTTIDEQVAAKAKAQTAHTNLQKLLGAA